jgi:hypothetical protein
MSEREWEDPGSRELADEPLFQPPAADDAAETGLGDALGDPDLDRDADE